jgi:tight adherence protein B
MRSLLFVLAALAVIAVLEAVFQLIRWSDERRQDELRRRLKSMGEGSLDATSSLLRPGRYAASPGLDSILRSLPLTSNLERLLEQADSRFTVAQILGWSALAAGAGILGTSLLSLGGMLGALATVCGGAAPVLLLLASRGRRSRKLSEQLPDALDMMGRSLRAGHALTAAFELVANEMPEPVAVEFGRAFEAQRLGLPVDQAIVQMTERSPGNRDLKIFAVSALVQRETGGNLAEVLSNIAETIRARYRFYGKLRALTAEGRASALLVGAMPFIMALILRVMQPEYLVPLVATELGRMMLGTAAVAWAVGVLWLYQMIQLDV